MSYCWFEYQKAYESIIDGNPDSEDRFSFVIAEEESAFVEADRVQEPYARGMRTSCEKITPFFRRSTGTAGQNSRICETLSRRLSYRKCGRPGRTFSTASRWTQWDSAVN